MVIGPCSKGTVELRSITMWQCAAKSGLEVQAAHWRALPLGPRLWQVEGCVAWAVGTSCSSGQLASCWSPVCPSTTEVNTEHYRSSRTLSPSLPLQERKPAQGFSSWSVSNFLFACKLGIVVCWIFWAACRFDLKIPLAFLFELWMTPFTGVFDCFLACFSEIVFAQVQDWFITDISCCPLAKCVRLTPKPILKNKMFWVFKVSKR